MAGGRSLPNGSGTSEIDPARTGDGRLGRLGEGVGLDPQGPGQLAAAQDLDQVPLVGQARRHQGGDVRGVPLDGAQGADVDRGVLHPERVLEAAELGDPLHEGQLATLEAHRDGVAGALALGPAAGRLATLAGDAAADPLARAVGTLPGGGAHGPSWSAFLVFAGGRDVHQVRDPCDHPTDLGAVRQHVGAPDATESEGPQGAPVLGLGADGGADLGDPDPARRRQGGVGRRRHVSSPP